MDDDADEFVEAFSPAQSLDQPLPPFAAGDGHARQLFNLERLSSEVDLNDGERRVGSGGGDQLVGLLVVGRQARVRHGLATFWFVRGG